MNLAKGNKFITTFLVKSAINSNFQSSFGKASKTLEKVKQSMSKVKNTQGSLKSAFFSGTISANNYNKAIGKLSKKEQFLTKCTEKYALSNKKYVASLSDFKNKGASLVKFGAAFGGVIYGLKSFLNPAIKFEKSMSNVKALSGASASQLKRLGDMAQYLGANTKYSAIQSADALGYMAQAGWKPKEMLDGMSGVLSLASAGNADLATTADIVTDNLTAFGLAADKSNHLADVYAVVTSNANTNVALLGETMKYVAPVSKALNVTMEETVTVAGLLANAGIKGSAAGTALRSGLLRLSGASATSTKAMSKLGVNISEVTAQQQEAKGALENMGISMKDQFGTPKKMSAILTELRNKTEDMSKADKTAAISKIFGTNAANSWLALINQSPEAFDKMTAAVDKSKGAAKKMADIMNDNADGALTRFSSASESIAINMGTALLPALAIGAKYAAKFATVISGFAKDFPTLTRVVVLGGLAIGGIVLGVKAAKLAYAGYNVVKAATIALTNKGLLSLALSKGAWVAESAVKGIATGAQWLFNASLLGCPIMWLVGGLALVIAGGVALYKNWDWVVGKIKDGFNTITTFGTSFIEGAGSWGIDAVDAIINPFTMLPDKLKNYVSGAWSGIKNKMFNSGKTTKVAHNAKGGIYSESGSSGFLTTFAERGTGGESAIGHKRNSRNLNLWSKTGAILGAKSSNTGTANYTTLNINVTGNVDNTTIQKIKNVVSAEIEKINKKNDFENRRRRRVVFD